MTREVPVPGDPPTEDAGSLPNPPAGPDRRGLSLPEWGGLLLLLSVFVIVVTYLGDLRVENFFATNWDLGLNQQMLWTTTHGRLLYEAGDFEFYGVQSFLQVHSTYVALLVAPVYAALPVPGTLFAVQAAFFGVSAVPLYLIGRPLFRHRELAFGAIIVYLASFAVLSALLYDFHWEALIPLEFLSLFLLLRRRQFLLALVPLFAGILTLEVFPFLVGGVVLYFLWERLDRVDRHWRTILRDREIRFYVVLLVVAAAGYVVLRFLQYLVVPHFVGVAGTATGASHALTSPFVFAATPSSLGKSAVYWWLILAAMGFLPLLSPRGLVLSLPWFIDSTILSPSFASQFGNQYALVAVATLAVPFVYGLSRISSTELRFPYRTGIALALGAEAIALIVFALTRAGSRALLGGSLGAPVIVLVVVGPLAGLVLLVIGHWRHTTASPAPPRPEPQWAHRAHRPLLIGTLVALIVFSVAMSPVNLNNFEATPYPGYSFQWSENPAAHSMEWVVGHVPGDAQVLASDNLFPYVANNPNSYALPWFRMSPSAPVPYFPFRPSNLPRFVLVDTSEMAFVPTFLSEDLFNASVYGLVAYVYTTGYPGTIYLFEEGYHQPPVGRVAVAPADRLYFTAENLSLGPVGRAVVDPGARFGVSVVSQAGTGTDGNDGIWYGPYVDLLPGNYHVVVNLSGRSPNPAEPLLDLNFGVFFPGTTLRNFTWSPVNPGELSPTGWTSLAYNLSFDLPYPLVEFRGFLDFTGNVPNGSVTLNYIEVDRVP